MRNFALAVLLAIGVSAPAVAQEQVQRSREDIHLSNRGERGNGNWGGGHGGGRRWGGQSQQAQPAQRSAPQISPQSAPQRSFGGDGGGRRWNGGDGGQRRAAPQAVPQPVPQSAPQSSQRNWDGRRGYEVRGTNEGSGNRGFQRRGGDLNASPQSASPQAIPQTRDLNRGDRNRNGNRDWNGHQRGDNRAYGDGRNWSERGRGNGSWQNDRRNENRRYTDRDRRHDGYSNNRSWNRDWRHDNRYDWKGYRNYNRGYYQQPRYYNPYGYGYGYSRFSIGFHLDSLFYSDRYHISDPYSYRLPPADGPYRWVRYYNDALLVDTYTGEVVDAIYGFFY